MPGVLCIFMHKNPMDTHIKWTFRAPIDRMHTILCQKICFFGCVAVDFMYVYEYNLHTGMPRKTGAEKMKRGISLLLILLLCVGIFSACSRGDGLTYSQSNLPSQKREVLRISTSPDFAPMVFVNPEKKGQEQFVGFDISLAKFIADELDMELEIMPMDFNSCQLAVYAGTVDMSISGYTWSQSRSEQYNLSDHYYAGNSTDNQVLVTLAGNEGRFTELSQLKNAVIGVQNASLQQILAQEQLTESEIDLFLDLDTAVLQLLNGDFDCIAVSDGGAEAIIANHPEIIRSGFSFELDERYHGNVILLQKGNDELTAQVNEILIRAAEHYESWYQEAKSTAGIQVTYDKDGNVVE